MFRRYTQNFRKKRSKLKHKRMRSTLQEDFIALELDRLKELEIQNASEVEESIEKPRELSKESSVQNLDPLQNSSVPVHLKSKVNYFFTPYNNKFEFSNGELVTLCYIDPLQINEGQNWKVLTDFICDNDSRFTPDILENKFDDRCELIKHNLEMEDSEKNSKSKNQSLKLPIRPKKKKSFSSQAVKILDEDYQGNLDRKLSVRMTQEFLPVTPNNRANKSHSPMIREEESGSNSSVSRSNSTLEKPTHKISIRKPKERQSIIMKEIDYGMKALLK